MNVDVFAADEQTAEPVDTLRWIKLAEAVLADEGVRGDAELSMLFVDETAISDLNKRFLGREGPTDVLSFPIDEEPPESGRSPDSGGSGPGYTGEPPEAPTLLGDVVICPSVARRNAPDHAGTYEDELALLVVHGVLHLLGMDHEDDAEAELMEAKERDLLAKHHGPVPRLTPDPAAASETAPPPANSAPAPEAPEPEAPQHQNDVSGAEPRDPSAPDPE